MALSSLVVKRLLAFGAAIAILGVATAAWWMVARPFARDDSARVLFARRILTMDPARPIAEAVAIAKGRIVCVGSREEVLRVVEGRGFRIERRFEDRVLLPGFIDPHVHPTLAATILPMDIVSAVQWWTPNGVTRVVRGHRAFLDRLRELGRAKPAGEWLLVWGYHAPYHGKLGRAELDAVSTVRPIFVWQRSVHEMFFNTRALEELGMTREEFDRHPQADWDDGHLWERGTLDLGRPMARILASPGRYLRGLSMMSKVLHRGGLTTVGEQGFPQINAMAEWLTLHWEMARPSTTHRFVLVPNAMFFFRREGDARGAERAAAGWLRWSSDAVRIVKHAKYYADGAIYSQLMRLSQPYLDGHRGEWMMTPDEQRKVLDTFWDRGWSIHVHVNGDAALDTLIEQLEAERARAPDPARRVVLEHYGYAREDQHVRVARDGALVSNNAYYLYELAPIYATHGLGPARAENISPLGGLLRAGVRFSFHSDYPMAPAEPLTLVWVAVNRIGSDGRVWGEDQRISLDAALRAITIEAAWSLGLEDEIGSIRRGKRADFTILDADPHEVSPMKLRDIGIVGTVLDGRFSR